MPNEKNINPLSNVPEKQGRLAMSWDAQDLSADKQETWQERRCAFSLEGVGNEGFAAAVAKFKKDKDSQAGPAL